MSHAHCTAPSWLSIISSYLLLNFIGKSLLGWTDWVDLFILSQDMKIVLQKHTHFLEVQKFFNLRGTGPLSHVNTQVRRMLWNPANPDPPLKEFKTLPSPKRLLYLIFWHLLDQEFPKSKLDLEMAEI